MELYRRNLCGTWKRFMASWMISRILRLEILIKFLGLMYISFISYNPSKSCCRTCRKDVATCEKAQFKHRILLPKISTTFRFRNPNPYFPDADYVFPHLEIRNVAFENLRFSTFSCRFLSSSKKYGPRTNVFAMPYHTVTLASYKGFVVISHGISLAHWMEFFELTFPVKILF